MRYQRRIILISLFIMFAVVISQVPQINNDGTPIKLNADQQSYNEPNIISAYPAPPTEIPYPAPPINPPQPTLTYSFICITCDLSNETNP